MVDSRPPLDEWRAQQIAEAAAQKASEATFSLLGIDIDNQTDCNAIRDDLSFLRRQREARELLARETRKGVVSIVFSGVAWAAGGAVSVAVAAWVYLKAHT